MKTFYQKLIILICLIFLFACSPISKESYLERYKEFMEKVATSSDEYSENDWNKVDKKFDKFSDIWYSKYKEELIWKEHLLLTKYEVQYNYYKAKKNSKVFFEKYFKDNYNELKKQIKYYAENDMGDDIDFLIEKANEIGGEAVEMLEKILIELEVEYKIGYSVKLNISNSRDAK